MVRDEGYSERFRIVPNAVQDRGRLRPEGGRPLPARSGPKNHTVISLRLEVQFGCCL